MTTEEGLLPIWPYDVPPGCTRLLIMRTRHLGMHGPAPWVGSLMDVVQSWPKAVRPEKEEVARGIHWDIAMMKGATA